MRVRYSSLAVWENALGVYVPLLFVFQIPPRAPSHTHSLSAMYLFSIILPHPSVSIRLLAVVGFAQGSHPELRTFWMELQ